VEELKSTTTQEGSIIFSLGLEGPLLIFRIKDSERVAPSLQNNRIQTC